MKIVSHVYLLSAALGSVWRIIGSTDASSCVGEDFLSLFDLPRGELEFADAMLTESVDEPLTLVGRRSGKYLPIAVIRGGVFDTSMCLALCFDAPAEELLAFWFGHGLEGAAASPLSLELARGYDTTKPFGEECYDSSRVIREALALGDVSEKGRGFGASALEELASCISELFSVNLALTVSDISPFSSDRGRVFSMGFCIGCLVFMAMAARSYSRDGEVQAHAFCGNGYVTLDISFDTRSGEKHPGTDLFVSIAESYGIPIDIRAEDGRVRCIVIPEYADEALEGVKEHILSIRDFIDSFAQQE